MRPATCYPTREKPCYCRRGCGSNVRSITYGSPIRGNDKEFRHVRDCFVRRVRTHALLLLCATKRPVLGGSVVLNEERKRVRYTLLFVPV